MIYRTMKKSFETPIALIESFASEDVIAASVLVEGTNGDNQNIWWTDSFGNDNGGYDIFD